MDYVTLIISSHWYVGVHGRIDTLPRSTIYAVAVVLSLDKTMYTDIVIAAHVRSFAETILAPMSSAIVDPRILL